MGGSLKTLGYSAGRKSTIDVTGLIWKRASIKSFSLFAQPPEMWRAAWKAICALLESGAVKPIVSRTFALEDAAERCVSTSKAGLSGGLYLRYDDDLVEHACASWMKSAGASTVWPNYAL
jgi:NADPH:quinone reductase-like Zn-dependent oxidoreductase